MQQRPPNYSRDRDVDLAAAQLDYQRFRELAHNPHLSPNNRIGFIEGQRLGYEVVIFADILAKLPALAASRGLVVVDIGPGCADLPHRLIALCQERGHRLILADSPEMLAHLPDVDGVTVKVPGQFPASIVQIRQAIGPMGADACLAYSVLQYLFVDSNPFSVVDATVQLLARGGRALYGDVPNHSKRTRFFASPAGHAFHMRAMQTSTEPVVAYNEPVPGKIDDAVLAGLVHRAQSAGCDAYLLPQGAALPMANRRDDLLIAKP